LSSRVEFSNRVVESSFSTRLECSSSTSQLDSTLFQKDFNSTRCDQSNNHMQIKNLLVLFNLIDHAETYFNSSNILLMKNVLFFNSYFHMKVTNSFVYLNFITHSQMLNHITFSKSYDLVQANNHIILFNSLNLIALA